MAEQDQSLDAFFNQIATPENNNNEDEFTKLLNDFVNQGKEAAAAAKNGEFKATLAPEATLDSFLTSQTDKEEAQGLDSFLSDNVSAPKVEGLDDILTQTPATVTTNGAISSPQEQSQEENDKLSNLKAEEQELARAVANFKDGVQALSDKKKLKMPKTDYTETMLSPNYKPSVGRKIAQYLLACWDVINQYDPENMKRLPKDAGDEEYLAFSETLNDTDLQLSIISYVEILINLEICEVNYEQKREVAQKNRIKKELYDEYMELQARKALFIKKLKEKKFPIDADKLINNYFRAAQKDAEGSFEALTKNPAMFSPIEFDKIRPKFFGLIKVTPEDGIKANQKIGNFIKKLKV